MLGVVRLANPQDEEFRLAIGRERFTEVTGDLGVPPAVMADAGESGVLEGLQAGGVAPAAMKEMPVPVGVEHVGGPGRGVGEDEGAAAGGDSLGKGGTVQGASRRPPPALPEFGRPHRHRLQPLTLVERNGIAGQAVARGQAAGRDRGRVHPRRGGKDAAMGGEHA